MAKSTVNNCHYKSVQQKFGCHYIEKFKGFVLCMVCWILMNTLAYDSLDKKQWLLTRFFLLKLVGGTKLKLQKGHEVVFNEYRFIRIEEFRQFSFVIWV